MVQFAWDVYPTVNWVVSLVVMVCIYAFIMFMYTKVVKRTAGYVFLAASFVCLMITYLIYLEIACIVVATLSGVGITITLFSNLGDLRLFLANPFKSDKGKVGKTQVDKVFSREQLYKAIEKTVLSLAKSKTGAIITFEKNVSLSETIKNGIMVNAPVTPELLETIFYTGTRLHDGAVVIRDNMIIAASVFYKLSTEPMAAKYGSRHRAAIGISEISDAVTVVVSEETGRISFAVDGQLDTVTADNFYRCLENYMGQTAGEE